MKNLFKKNIKNSYFQSNYSRITSSIYGIRSYAKLGFFGGRHGTTWGQLPSLHIRGPGFAYAKLIPGPPVSINRFDKQTCWLLRSAC